MNAYVRQQREGRGEGGRETETETETETERQTDRDTNTYSQIYVAQRHQQCQSLRFHPYLKLRVPLLNVLVFGCEHCPGWTRKWRSCKWRPERWSRRDWGIVVRWLLFTSWQHVRESRRRICSVSRRWICSDTCTCSHTTIDVMNQTCYRRWS